MKQTSWIATLIVLASLAINGCDNIQSAPKIIVADGDTYVACAGMVWVDTEGGGLLGGTSTFKVSYTDSAGLVHVLRGLKTVQVNDVPKLIDAPMPNNPPMIDKDGKSVAEGRIYYWENGVQARFHNGKWEPVQIPNTLCKNPVQ